MNINTLAEIVDLFEIEVVKSGLKRDTQDYINSWGSNQDNSVALRDIAEKTLTHLDRIYNGDLPDLLKRLLVTNIEPFTNHPHNTDIRNLLDDKEIVFPHFSSQLNLFLNKLNTEVIQNFQKIEEIKNFIEPYIEKQETHQADENKAVISILFKDNKTVTSLKEFTKSIQGWSRVLPLYHQLLKNEPHEDIEIVTVQNGSIDILINIDFDIALNLTEVFKYSLQTFMALLRYKKNMKSTTDSFYGNEIMIKAAKVIEEEMINNIGEVVKKKIEEQHKKALERDAKIEKNIDKKLEQIVKLVTSHTLKGNEIKLLAHPEPENDEDNEKNNSNIKEELRNISSEVRQALNTIPAEVIKVLLEKYSSPQEEETGS